MSPARTMLIPVAFAATLVACGDLLGPRIEEQSTSTAGTPLAIAAHLYRQRIVEWASPDFIGCITTL